MRRAGVPVCAAGVAVASGAHHPCVSPGLGAAGLALQLSPLCPHHRTWGAPDVVDVLPSISMSGGLTPSCGRGEEAPDQDEKPHGGRTAAPGPAGLPVTPSAASSALAGHSSACPLPSQKQPPFPNRTRWSLQATPTLSCLSPPLGRDRALGLPGVKQLVT